MAEATTRSTAGRWMGCNVDFGNEQSLELDYRIPEVPWLSIGSGIQVADVWFKGFGGLPDIRIRIARIDDGIQVQLDRSEQSSTWWPKDAPPRLKVAFDQPAGTVMASAAVGMGDEFQEVELGTIQF